MSNNKIKPPFQPPEQYFDQLPGQLMESIQASEGTEDKKLVLPVAKALPFSAPEGYFEQLGQQVMSAIHSVEKYEMYLHTLNADRTFSVPEGYFETFAGQVMYRIHQADDDLVDTSFLAGMKEEQPYQVPAGYFEEVRFQPVTGATEDKQPGLKISRPNRRMWKWTNWAAAASVFIIFCRGRCLDVWNGRNRRAEETSSAGVSDAEQCL
ncbi:MAG: hypothetical protein KL787_03145 [Taibaiella sp.]|nr:hypothetical protein [Taibaiella sp.]